MNRFVRLAAPLLLAPLAHAQSASVTVSHDDPDGFVTPGQTVRITAAISRTGGIQVAGVSGDLAATPDVGIASNVAYGHGMCPTIFPGSLIAGSLRGYDVASLPPFFVGGIPIPPWALLEFTLFSYDWTAPATPGQIEFAFEPSPTAPNIRLYMTALSPEFVEVESFYIPTTLTVVPSPAPVFVLACAGFSIHGRRRW